MLCGWRVLQRVRQETAAQAALEAHATQTDAEELQDQSELQATGQQDRTQLYRRLQQQYSDLQVLEQGYIEGEPDTTGERTTVAEEGEANVDPVVEMEVERKWRRLLQEEQQRREEAELLAEQSTKAAEQQRRLADHDKASIEEELAEARRALNQAQQAQQTPQEQRPRAAERGHGTEPGPLETEGGTAPPRQNAMRNEGEGELVQLQAEVSRQVVAREAAVEERAEWEAKAQQLEEALERARAAHRDAEVAGARDAALVAAAEKAEELRDAKHYLELS